MADSMSSARETTCRCCSRHRPRRRLCLYQLTGGGLPWRLSWASTTLEASMRARLTPRALYALRSRSHLERRRGPPAPCPKTHERRARCVLRSLLGPPHAIRALARGPAGPATTSTPSRRWQPIPATATSLAPRPVPAPMLIAALEGPSSRPNPTHAWSQSCTRVGGARARHRDGPAVRANTPSLASERAPAAIRANVTVVHRDAVPASERSPRHVRHLRLSLCLLPTPATAPLPRRTPRSCATQRWRENWEP